MYSIIEFVPFAFCVYLFVNVFMSVEGIFNFEGITSCKIYQTVLLTNSLFLFNRLVVVIDS